MVRLDILAPRRSGEALLRAVHRAGVLHVVPFETPPEAGPALFGVEPASVPTAKAQRLLERLGELRAVLGSAPPRPGDVAALWEVDLGELERRVAALDPVRAEAARLAGERLRTAAERDRLARHRELIAGLERVAGRVPVLPGFGATGIVVGARHRAVFPLLRDELETLTGGRCELVTGDLDGDRVAGLLIYPLRDAPAVQSLVGGRNLEEIALPEELTGAALSDLGPRLAAREDQLAAEVRTVEDALAGLAAREAPGVAALAVVAADRLAELEVLAGAGVSDHLVCLGGWAPAAGVPALAERLAREVGEDVVVVERPPEQRPPHGAPVALQNRGFLRAFEPLTTFVAVPRYGTLDPTPLLALVFPAFVGLMIGDAGYGLVLVALLALARWRFGGRPLMQAIWPIGLAAGIATIAFGILFGEWFGDLGHRALGTEPIWISREEGLLPLLALAIAIGVAQVGLGLILGAVNAARLRERRETVGRLAIAVVFGTALVGLAAIAGLVPPGIGTAALVALGGAAVLAVLSLGIVGPIEAMGLLGRVLSYARLTAIGLASVTLAVVANRLGSLADNLVVGVLIAGLLHALNLGIGVFDASIQGLRLQYVEFFGTFVEAGGTPYAPFRSALDRPAGASFATTAGGS
jgi:V/A-type H+/Na+-transporting ATPase subunit I